MLARRLLMFALILLVVTAISAALAPPPRPVGDGSPSPTPSAEDDGGSRVVEHSVSTARTRPSTIEVEAGDVLRLTVRSPEPGAVALRDLASARAIAPGSPVVYDVLVTEPGDYPVVTLDDERTVATVRVVTRRE